MKELRIHHLAGLDENQSRVRLSCRVDENAAGQHWESSFAFPVPADQAQGIHWYWGQYLQSPWNDSLARAAQAEAAIDTLGAGLFKAVFSSPEALALYAQVADDLANTRVVVQTDTAAAAVLPWEFMHDPARGEYGYLSCCAFSFHRCVAEPVSAPMIFPANGSPIHVLVVADPRLNSPGCAPLGTPLAFAEMIRGLGDRLRMEFFRPANHQALRRFLEAQSGRFQILHWQAPAKIDPGDESSGLGLPGENVGPALPSVAALASLLKCARISCLFLDAAEGKIKDDPWISPSLAGAFARAGAPLIAAIPGVLSRGMRCRFWNKLYEGVANGEEIIRTVAAAREDLRANASRFSPIGDLWLKDWMAPILYAAGPAQWALSQPRASRLKLNEPLGRQIKASAEIDCPDLPPWGLLGRDENILAVDAAAAAHSIVLIEGVAGVGKTELALGWARWRAEMAACLGPVFFFRFQYHLPLSQIFDRAGQLFLEEMRALFQKDWSLLTAHERKQAVITFLRQTQCVMIWDNFEGVAGYPSSQPSAWAFAEQQEIREFLEALKDGKTRILITSRRDEPWLGPVYQRLQLQGLERAPAQQWAVKAMLGSGMTFRQIKALAPYNSLLEFLHGNPLAIQIVAPDLRRKTPEELLRELKRHDAQTGPASAVAAALKHRLENLDAVLRRRLAVLGMFNVFVSARVLAAMSFQNAAPPWMLELSREDWMRILEALADLGLLRRLNEGTYAIHAVLQSSYTAMMREVFADHMDWLERAFCAVTGRAGNQLFQIFQANGELALAILGWEQYNLLHACQLARRRRDWDNLKEILCGLRALLTSHGRWSEWESLVLDLESEVGGLSSGASAAAEILWFRLVGHRAEIGEYRQDHAGLRAIHAGLRTLYPHLRSSEKQEDVLDDLGAIAEDRHYPEEAERFYLKSLSIKQQHGDEPGQGDTLLRLGDLAAQRRHFREAERWYRQGVDLWERRSQPDPKATFYCRLGALDQARGEFDEAEQWYRQSLNIRTQLGDESRQALALHQLGRIAHERRDYPLAEERYRASLEIRRRIGDDSGLAATWHQLGRLTRDQKRAEESEKCFQEALQLRKKRGDEAGQAQSIHQLGNVAFLQGRYAEAEAWYHQSLGIRERLKDVHGMARNLNQLGKIAQANGHREMADGFFGQAEALFQKIQNPSSGLQESSQWMSH